MQNIIHLHIESLKDALNSFLGSLFGKNSDGLDVKLGGLFRNQQDKNGEVNWRLDKISDKLEQLEMAIENKGYKLPVKPGEQAPSVNEAPKKIVDTPKKGVSFKMAGNLIQVMEIALSALKSSVVLNQDFFHFLL